MIAPFVDSIVANHLKLNMHKIYFFLVLLLKCFGLLAQGHNLDDLRILHNEGSFEEYLNHALDVRPSLRSDEWKSMTTKMAESLAKSLGEKESIEHKDFLKVEQLYQWPVLKSDDIFKTHRNTIGLKFLKKCLSSPDPCWSDLKLFWQANKTEPELSFSLAQLVSKLDRPQIDPWEFMQIALKSPLSEFYCKKDFVMEALWSKIELITSSADLKKDLIKKIDLMVHPDCLPSVIAESKKRLFQPKKLIDREVAFEILKSQGKASQELTDFFYTLYLLETPSQGETFNFSWNRLKELGKVFSRRELVLKKIKILDPIPDLILSSYDEIKKQAVLYHFKAHFPEYLEFYVKQCLNFYSGETSFPNGNPTINCQKLMNLKIAPNLVGDDQVQRFFKIIKF